MAELHHYMYYDLKSASKADRHLNLRKNYVDFALLKIKKWKIDHPIKKIFTNLQITK